MIVLIGVISFQRLTVREYPKIDTPVVSVRTVYKGASPQVMESQITQPLEDSISGIEGVRSVKSVSREEVSQITVEFVLERNVDAASNDVRDRVARVRALLPDGRRRVGGVQDRGRRAGDPLDAPVERPAQPARDLRLRRPLRRRPAEDAARRRLGDHRRRAPLRDAPVDRPRPARRLRPDAAPTWRTACGARTSKFPPGASNPRSASSRC